MQINAKADKSYSHSIINKPSKLLIYKGLATASALFTVTFTVNLD